MFLSLLYGLCKGISHTRFRKVFFFRVFAGCCVCKDFRVNGSGSGVMGWGSRCSLSFLVIMLHVYEIDLGGSCSLITQIQDCAR